ncbi:SLAP domain-containing protein [Psychrobacillus sp. OK028]|uniref:SLAP domain-containing protein n=1 Tax=Psychrobacillus sp. OK028 TaxID=1884359 RepID=UPI000887CB88|nr:SLAP domain-containing protein [Psychrobacillus sp. OK028]SDN33382.1 SLAP domain-containing protein [Psychrobacillus sp. OK028]
MQKLQFEASWEQAIAIKDRELITDIFQNSKVGDGQSIRLEPIWEAMNYKGEILITVLIHNFTDTELTFQNQKLTYIEKESIIAEHIFTVPKLIIKPISSTPWTFIFPIESLIRKEICGNGQLEMETKHL